jgi:hypothetical protein
MCLQQPWWSGLVASVLGTLLGVTVVGYRSGGALVEFVALDDQHMALKAQFPDVQGGRFGVRLQWPQSRTPPFLAAVWHPVCANMALCKRALH